MMGATIMLLGRNKEKTMKVVDDVNDMSNSKNTHYVPFDLASQKSIRNAAEIILDKCPKIDLLINCAGMNSGVRKETEDGYEMNWGVNHLGPFLFTHLLLEHIKETSNSRIVNLSSATESWTKINFKDIQYTRKWRAGRTYAQAKLAMNMWTRKMAKELDGTGITINSLNPGFIKTNLKSFKGWRRVVGEVYMFFFASKQEVGGDRILRLALSKEFENVNGEFVFEDKIREPNPEALDDKIVDKVWKISKEHVGI
jgi:NAD(P)-dependent dehydrogenase (short-subunit alcohol dehydrogenase family)